MAVSNNLIKVCFNCKTYIRIFPDNPESKKIELRFDFKHHSHMVQIANKDELDNNYKRDELYERRKD